MIEHTETPDDDVSPHVLVPLIVDGHRILELVELWEAA